MTARAAESAPLPRYALRPTVSRADTICVTQLDLISRLMALEPPVFLFGGFAEDAVLYGKVSRPHQDADVLIWLDELAMRIEQVRAFGFHSFDVRFEAAPGHPLAVGAQSNGLDLEFCIGERDSLGRPFFYRPSSTGLQRCWLPPDALSYPPRISRASGYDSLAAHALSSENRSCGSIWRLTAKGRPSGRAARAVLCRRDRR